MNPFRVWRRPVAMLEQVAGLATVGGLWYWWLGVAESTIASFMLSIFVLLLMIVAAWLLIRRGRQRLGGESNSTGQSLTALLLLAMSLAAAYYLIWWVPAISSLSGQTISVVLRFGVAFALVLTFWANLLGGLAAYPARP